MKCFMTDLHRNFSDNLVGLRLNSDGKAELWEDDIPCCHKKELRTAFNVRGISVCDLSSRIKQINSILDQFEATWEMKFPFYSERNNKLLKIFTKNLREKNDKHLYKGFAFNSKLDKQASPNIWLMAIIGIWRFGCRAHVVTLGKKSAYPLLPTGDSFPKFMLVEQVASLRVPHVAYDFSVLVNWCEGAMIPLWFDVFNENKTLSTKDPRSLNTKKSYELRLAKYKNLPPLSWMEPDSLSRLKSVCSNFSQYC